MKKLLITLVALALLLGIVGCSSRADVVSHNLSAQADQFNVERQIVFFNGITDKYLLVIEGRCSLGNDDPVKQLSVTCEIAPNQFEKHFLGLSDNVSYFVQQVAPNSVSEFHYQVVFHPENIVPDPIH